MKKNISLFCFIAVLQFVSFAQVEKEINATIKKVTVFTTGAQIDMEASVPVVQGPMILRLSGLSPYIKPESVRVDGDGAFTIHNVQYQTDYTKELERNRQIESLKSRVEALELKVEDENTWIKILNQKIDFLNVNKNISAKEQVVPTETFKNLHAYYSTSIETLTFDVLKRQRVVNDYNKEISNLNYQLNSLNNNFDLPSGIIVLSVDVKQSKTSKLKCSYVVQNASWYPSYDIRFDGIGKPLVVTHKANITQNTGIDWKNVDLVLSTAKTDISAQIPQLGIFFLEYFVPTARPVISVDEALKGKAAGVRVQDGDTKIQIRGISSLEGSDPLYIVDGVPQASIKGINTQDIANISILKDAASCAIYGARGANGVILVTTKKDKGESSSFTPLVISYKNETTSEYFVDAPQTVLSNNTTTTVQYREANVDASFEYQSVPKLSAHMYLIGKINDWYKAELLDGQVNVYLENSYVGKSYINTQQLRDTLELSFGVDNNISIKREKMSDFTARQFIGSNKKESVGYKITVRNNKTYPVTTTISDQIPVSTLKEIEVESLELSGGILDAITGFIKWNVKLNPNETKELQLKYSVKYPKNKKVVIE